MCFLDSENLRFYKTLSSIPVVNSALHIGSIVYRDLKKYNQYVGTALDSTEQIVVYIANTPTMKSVAIRMEKPVLFIDGLAADGIQMLGNKYPSIRMTPEDLKEEASKQMVALKDVGVNKLDEVMQAICRQRKLGMAKALHFFESMFSPKISIYVDIIEKTMNDYLPPVDGSNEQSSNGNRQRVFARLAFIPNTVEKDLRQRFNQFVFRITWTETESVGNPNPNQIELETQQN